MISSAGSRDRQKRKIKKTDPVMKERDIYADLRCLSPLIVRVDGRSFKSSLSRLDCEKPYDERFAHALVDSAELFFKKSGISATLAYTFSDEISILFHTLPFDGRVEKLNSVVSSYISSAFSIKMGLDEPVAFDSRIVPLSDDLVVPYMEWRQAEAWRNCLSSYGFYTLVSEGLSEKEAASLMQGKRSADIHELLFARGINPAKLPSWQRRCIVIRRCEYEIRGRNPVTGG